ncbi:MAG: Rrf2 family transcriptional regulator [bacterium]|nr:Rrf2 family transcriptional regulator [bacterium]
MATILKISDAASLASHMMVIIASANGRLVTAKEGANQLIVSEAHMSKVMQRLAKHGLVKSVRGPGGGFQLIDAPEKITLLQIYEAIDGPLTEDMCLLNNKACIRMNCIMGTMIDSINKQVRDYFTTTNLAMLIE